MVTSERSLWCRELAASVLEPAGLHDSPELRRVSEDNQVLSAFVFMHISVCHVEGVTSGDISSLLDAWRPDEAWADLVVSSISGFRRQGVDVPLTDNLHATWLSFAELTRVLGGLDDPESAVDDLFSRADLSHLEIDGFIHRLLGRPPDLDAIFRGVMRHQQLVQERRPPTGWEYRLEAPHLDDYRRAVLAVEDAHRSGSRGALAVAGERLLGELRAWLTPIEFNAVFPDPESRVLLDKAFEASRTVYVAPHLLERSWGDIYPGDEEGWTPEWLYDHVTTGGARTDTYTTGTMHCWVLVSEGAWDFRRISRTAREVEQVGIAEDDQSVTLSLLLPEHSGDADPLAIDYRYAYGEAEGLRALTVMAATGYVRLEVYAIGAGRLDFLGARAVWLPEGLAERIYDLTARALRMARQDSVELGGLVLDWLSPESQAESRFRASENARHELLWNTSFLATRGAMSSVDRDALEAGRLGYLAAEAERAHQILGGSQDDDSNVVRARFEFEEVLARTRQPGTGVDVEKSRLRSRQAFLHVERRDGGLDWVAAGVGSDGSWYRWSPQEPDEAVDAALRGFFRARAARSTCDLADAIDRVVEGLDRSAAEMMGMLSERGVEQVVVSPGAELDGIPVHLLDFGAAPCAVAYAPSLKFLDAIVDMPSDLEQASVVSYAGAGPLFLPHVNDEAAVIVRLYGEKGVGRTGATPTHLHRASGSRVLHLACHGRAHQDLALRGLLLSPDGPQGFVSVADILRKDPLLGTELVFLSACSSSVAYHDTTLVQAFGGVDFAFLAAGARAAVSTLWNINDVTAALFAVVFHSVLVDDFDVPRAYRSAQDALRSDLGSLPAEASEALDAVWPNWLEDWRRAPMRSHRVHWGAYRISGLVYE